MLNITYGIYPFFFAIPVWSRFVGYYFVIKECYNCFPLRPPRCILPSSISFVHLGFLHHRMSEHILFISLMHITLRLRRDIRVWVIFRIKGDIMIFTLQYAVKFLGTPNYNSLFNFLSMPKILNVVDRFKHDMPCHEIFLSFGDPISKTFILM